MFANSVKLVFKNWEALVLPKFGANVIRLKKDGLDILRFPTNMDILIESPYLYGMPILFPANRTENGKFYFEGEKYLFEINEPIKNNHIHGNMFNAPFSITTQSKSQVECIYINEKERYPFPFLMEIIYQLNENGLMQKIKIVNIGESVMPFVLGLHTTFIEPSIFNVPLGNRWEIDSNHIPTGNLIEINKEEKSYISGYKLNKKRISGFYTSAGSTAKIGNYFYRVSKKFNQWILYNGDGDEGFLCVEPQSGPVNGLNIKDGFNRLEKNSYIEFWSSIYDK